MKKIYFLLLFSSLSYAQNSVKVSFEEITSFRPDFFDAIPADTREFMKKALTGPKSFQLINNGDLSLYQTLHTEDVIIPSSEPPEVGVIDKGTVFKSPKAWILKDFKNQKTYSKRALGEESFYILNDFRNEEYIFTDQELTIETFKCKMAYTFDESKPADTIKYWYTEDIPISDGPYYTVSIPGLVLRYERKQRVIYATKIEFFDKKINIDGLAKDQQVVTENEFKIIKEKALTPGTFTDDSGKTTTTSSHTIKR